MKKIQIPSKMDRRILSLETENANLWYENIMLKSKVSSNEQEIADLWYEVVTGGNVNVNNG